MPTLTLSFAPQTRTADAAVRAPRKNLRVFGSDTETPFRAHCNKEEAPFWEGLPHSEQRPASGIGPAAAHLHRTAQNGRSYPVAADLPPREPPANFASSRPLAPVLVRFRSIRKPTGARSGSPSVMLHGAAGLASHIFRVDRMSTVGIFQPQLVLGCVSNNYLWQIGSRST
jgi:hypothetical protein